MSSKVTSAQESFLTRLEEFHKNWCEPIDWQQRSLKPFNKGQLGPGEAVWATKLQSYEPPMLERYIGIHKVKPMYWQYKKRKAANEDLKLYKEWEVNHPFVQQVMSGEQDVWREVLGSMQRFIRNKQLPNPIAYISTTRIQRNVMCSSTQWKR